MPHTVRLLSVLVILLVSIPALMAQDDQQTILPITQDVSYTVRPADTVDGIGALFDVSPTCIAERNELVNFRIRIGDVLLIEVSCPRYGEDPRDTGEQIVQVPRTVSTYTDDCEGYRVRQLDTLDVIGQLLDVSSVSLAVANDIRDGTTLRVNTCLIVPEDAPPYGFYPALDLPSSVDRTAGQGGGLIAGETYVIQPLDTLDVIAQRYNKSLVSIQLANGLYNSAHVRPGLTIIIPEDAPPYGMYPALGAMQTGTTYIVQRGDTLESIAQEFDVAVVALELANYIDSDADLFEGRTLLIPAGVPAYGDDAAMLGQGGGGLDVQVHVVQPRETLDGIAAFYNRDTTCLARANELARPSSLRPGQVLVIDVSCGPYVGEGVPALSVVVSPVTPAAPAADDDGEG